MLIEKPAAVMTFKLINGDEILGRKNNEKSTAEIVVISRPMKFMLTGTGGALISPLFTSNMSSGEMKVRSDHIVYSTPTDPGIAADYIQQISGIATPPAPNIVLS